MTRDDLVVCPGVYPQGTRRRPLDDHYALSHGMDTPTGFKQENGTGEITQNDGVPLTHGQEGCAHMIMNGVGCLAQNVVAVLVELLINHEPSISACDSKD